MLEFILQRIDLNLLKTISPEEENILKKNNALSDEKYYKVYMQFIMNNMNFILSVSDKKETKLSFKLYNMFFFDNDFTYRYDGQNIRYDEHLVNSEFSVNIILNLVYPWLDK